ncbi:ferredoxin reductase family protein [Mangrovihabitans endophyticus]|uniref:Oxidoreductase n=1 Tax=Mangrovihabitans endophyticus TaxID=1751298 RepID=A0A8J3C5W7_9ACTN|nr:ferric reductase-like transmembrane domain-containing protein [Mangrovihabitans endophyticus]GGL13756.1 oxidoreductase [Mangrovihabitans endophyticus]
MTATTRTLPRTGLPPAVTAGTLLTALAGINLLIVVILFVTTDLPVKNSLIETGRFFGVLAAYAIILQIFLIARLPWLDNRIGMDRLTSWHRRVGFSLFWTLTLHLAFIVAGYARLDGNPLLVQALSLAGSVPVLLGMAAYLIVLAVAVMSIRYARRRLQYETWHAVHLGLYAAVALALIHQLFEVTTFTATRAAAAYWWTLWILAVAALAAGRLILPLVRNARHQFRVSAVVPESDDVVSVHVTGRDLDRLPARAGQFMLWRFPGHNTWWQVNPFSLSAAPDGTSLRLTARAVGTTSAGLRRLTPGARVFAEGPYGAFTTAQRVREKTLLIAGGVGVTPIRALLEELRGDAIVLYRVRSADDAVLLSELKALAGDHVHVLTGRSSVVQPFTPANLATVVPDITDRDVYVCGPPAMTEAVLRSLRELGVPPAQTHAERFSLAS